MKNRIRDIERLADSINLNLNTHMGFGVGKPPLPLTPVITSQDSPESIIDNLEKKN